jgi:hypothetical protein
MYKEFLPIKCPPTAAKESNIEVFRIVKTKIPTEDDFVCYSNLYPNNLRYKSLCIAYAISFYDSFKNAKIAWEEAVERGNNIGDFIAQYALVESDGKNEYKVKTGHYSTWLYNSWDIKNFNPSFVQEIK